VANRPQPQAAGLGYTSAPRWGETGCCPFTHADLAAELLYLPDKAAGVGEFDRAWLAAELLRLQDEPAGVGQSVVCSWTKYSNG
jgi:hypothetical protein